jgi:spore coat-associated protein N
MKQILISMMTICIVSLMMVSGAFAANFSDVETSTGNTITAGTLDLVVNAENPLTSVLVDLDNICPGESQEYEIQLTNEGSQPGNSWMMFTDIVCTTGAYVEPEAAAEGGTPVDNLDSMIMVSIDGVEQGTMADIENTILPMVLLEPDGNGGSGTMVTLGFSFVDAGDTNLYQGDVCEFTIVIGLDHV